MRITVAVVLAGLLLVPGCAGGDAGTPDRTASATGKGTTSPTATSSEIATVMVGIQGGQVVPPTHRVEIASGEPIRIIVASDRADEVHVHGVDVEKKVTPGKPVTIVFTPDQPGLYEVETHESGLQLLQLVVR